MIFLDHIYYVKDLNFKILHPNVSQLIDGIHKLHEPVSGITLKF